MQVLVRDNNVEQALKVLKKKMQREGVFAKGFEPRHFHHNKRYHIGRERERQPFENCNVASVLHKNLCQYGNVRPIPQRIERLVRQ